MYVHVEEVVGIIATAAGTMFFIGTVARVYLRRLELKARGPALSPALEQRLDRIEQSVDTVAIEVERISEAVRFTTKVLADRREQGALPSPSGGERR